MIAICPQLTLFSLNLVSNIPALNFALLVGSAFFQRFWLKGPAIHRPVLQFIITAFQEIIADPPKVFTTSSIRA